MAYTPDYIGKRQGILLIFHVFPGICLRKREGRCFFEGSGWTAAHFSSWRAGLAAMMGGEYPGWVTGMWWPVRCWEAKFAKLNLLETNFYPKDANDECEGVGSWVHGAGGMGIAP
jgi:hypothetical protein